MTDASGIDIRPRIPRSRSVGEAGLSSAHFVREAFRFRRDRAVFSGNLEDLQTGVFSPAAAQRKLELLGPERLGMAGHGRDLQIAFCPVDFPKQVRAPRDTSAIVNR